MRVWTTAFYQQTDTIDRSSRKTISQFRPHHLTRLFELRKSRWEIRDSQSV